MQEGPVSAIFGHGIDSYKIVLIPYLEKEYNIGTESGASTGFTSLLVDTGLVGFILLLLNFVLVARRIIFKKANPGRIILFVSLALTAAWLPITQVLGIMLFYFMIMPGGLLLQLNADNSAGSIKNIS